jgi:hypothetical protein
VILVVNSLYSVLVQYLSTLFKKKPRVTQAHNMRVTENSVISIDPAALSMLKADFSDCSMWMTEFSVTHMLWACVTLGFCNSGDTFPNIFGNAPEYIGLSRRLATPTDIFGECCAGIDLS